MKIVYCIDSINNLGGIQRATLSKVNALAEIEGNELWIIVADNSGDRFFRLSPAVHFVDLGVDYYKDDWKSRWNVLKGILFKRIIHKKRLAEQLRRINPDVVISVGQSEKYFLSRIKGNWAKVREYHFVRNYRTISARRWLDKVVGAISDRVERFHIPKYDRVVVLTEEDKSLNWKNSQNVLVIPNTSDFNSPGPCPLDEKRVIAIGRLTYQKNFASLIRSFSKIVRRCPGWRLEIFGSGEEKKFLTELIGELGLEGKVVLKGISGDVRKELVQSSVLALSSRFEGLPMVLIEALSCGLPVVSYDCPCGPKDIITDGVNGFLVPEGDEDMLAEKICFLIEHEQERKLMGQEAFKSSSRYKLSNVIRQWMNLFETLVRTAPSR